MTDENSCTTQMHAAFATPQEPKLLNTQTAAARLETARTCQSQPGHSQDLPGSNRAHSRMSAFLANYHKEAVLRSKKSLLNE